MKCKCDFRTFMVGDGCDVCNPAKALEYARETIDEQAALIEEMGEALEGLDNRVRRVFRDNRWFWEDYPEIIKAAEVRSKWKESK